MKEVNKVIDKIGDYLWEVLFELRNNALSFDEISNLRSKLEKRFGYQRRSRFGKENHRRLTKNRDLEKDLAMLVSINIIELQLDEKYHVTPAGIEIIDYSQQIIPYYVDKLSSPIFATILTIIMHVILTVVKLTFGFLSMSAGFIADAIDNTVDTVSSVLIWLGLKFDKEKAVSIFIIVMMFASVGIIGYESVNKIISPEPVDHWVLTLIIILICGFVMLLLSIYQYLVGKRNNNFAILCQAVDSRNHFLTSLLVGIGIILSYIADSKGITWLLYGDAVASIIIGILILKSAIELTIELVKAEDDEEVSVSHFIGKSTEKAKERMLFGWLKKQLEEKSLTKEDICNRFDQDFCQYRPTIFQLTGVGYVPENNLEILQYVEKFITRDKILLKDNYYEISSKQSERKRIESLVLAETSILLKRFKRMRIYRFTINATSFALFLTAMIMMIIDLVKYSKLSLVTIIILSTFIPFSIILRAFNLLRIRKIVNNLKSAVLLRLVTQDNLTTYEEIRQKSGMLFFEQKILFKEMIVSNLLSVSLTEEGIEELVV